MGCNSHFKQIDTKEGCGGKGAGCDRANFLCARGFPTKLQNSLAGLPTQNMSMHLQIAHLSVVRAKFLKTPARVNKPACLQWEGFAYALYIALAKRRDVSQVRRRVTWQAQHLLQV